MSATLVLPQPDLSAQRTLYVVEMPALHTWEDRHCPECGSLTPHHEKNCYERWNEK